MRTGGADPVYLAGDPHGTMQVVYTPSTGTVTRRAQDPYGNPLGPVTTTTSAGATTPGTWPDNHGFLGKSESAATGLTDVGARAYDLTTGRFISVDPLLTLSESQAVNGYTYAAGNLVLKSDPTGLEPLVLPEGMKGINCDLKCRNGGYGASPGDGVKWAAAKAEEDTRNKWVAQHSPPVNDRTTLKADLQSVLENGADDWWQPHYREENGEWIDYCFGQSGCEEALKYLRHSGDVEGAKFIAATYCVFNEDSCKRKQFISAAGELLLVTAVGAFGGGGAASAADLAAGRSAIMGGARTAVDSASTAARSVEGVLKSLPKGKQSNVRTVPNKAELDATFRELTRSGDPTSWTNYNGSVYRLSDGTEIGMRASSKSGGETIDIRVPGQAMQKIHIDE